MEEPSCPAAESQHIFWHVLPHRVPNIPRRSWLHLEPNLILLLMAAGKADTRSVVNTSEITSLAQILSQVNLSGA